jgi:hypothetical protein
MLQHVKMRKERGSGHGFGQTFLVDDSIDNAAASGIAEQFLSRDEASTALRILTEGRDAGPFGNPLHFVERVRRL